jgi:hypothetical protein
VRGNHLKSHVNLSHLSTHFVCLFLYGITGLSASNQRITDTGKTPKREFGNGLGVSVDISAFFFFLSLSNNANCMGFFLVFLSFHKTFLTI